ncbi:MAG: septum formation protein Maf [Phycisphaerae bacterium]|nr:septum formation protein Maf [Phycisphaerae bacterium]
MSESIGRGSAGGVALPPHATLVLASASPRRAELLRRAGYKFIIRPSRCRELCKKPSSIPVEVWPVCVAMAKALAVQQRRHGDEIILAADTIVVVDGRILNKAHHRGQARAMLSLLMGRTHRVMTGMVLLADGAERMACATTVCRMKKASSDWLEKYLDSGQWRGKAGAYGIQDPVVEGHRMVRVISGEWHNVMGLPLDLLRQELAVLAAHR